MNETARQWFPSCIGYYIVIAPALPLAGSICIFLLADMYAWNLNVTCILLVDYALF